MLIGRFFYAKNSRLSVQELIISGSVLLLIALLSVIGFIQALIERLQHGPGLLFADVEILGFIAFIGALLGGAIAEWAEENLTKVREMEFSLVDNLSVRWFDGSGKRTEWKKGDHHGCLRSGQSVRR